MTFPCDEGSKPLTRPGSSDECCCEARAVAPGRSGDRRGSAGEAAGEPVAAAAEHLVVRRVVVRRVVVDGGAAPAAPIAPQRAQRPPCAADQARAPLLVAPATDAAGIGGPRLAARAVGAGVDQPPAADAAPPHTNPSTRAGSGRFSTASTAMHSAMIASFGVRVVRLVEPPAAAAVAGDRVRRVLVQLGDVGQLEPAFRDRGVQPRATPGSCG